jgi:hypothetical protein
VPSILRSRIALVALVGTFLVPIMTSSLRGLTHVLTCQEQSRTPFTLIIPEGGAPEAVTSTRFGRETSSICGGLSLNLGSRVLGSKELAMVIPITNTSQYVWRGTVKLVLDDTSIPVDIGKIEAGESATDTISFELEEGAHELGGSLLIGP